MKRIIKTMLLSALIMIAMKSSADRGTLTVRIDNVQADRGIVMVGVGDYKNNPTAMKGFTLTPDWESLICTFEGIEEGEQNIWVFHDLNGNYNLDLDANGLPIEGFAIDASGSWQPKALVNKQKQTVNLKMVYPQTK